MNTEKNINEKKAVVSMTVEQRLDRLERLVVKALMSLGLYDPTKSKMINIEPLPIAAKTVLMSRYHGGNANYNAEVEYVTKSVLALCSVEIAEQQAKFDAAEATREAERLAQERKAAQAEIDAAEKQRKEAQEKLAKLEPKPLS